MNIVIINDNELVVVILRRRGAVNMTTGPVMSVAMSVTMSVEYMQLV